MDHASMCQDGGSGGSFGSSSHRRPQSSVLSSSTVKVELLSLDEEGQRPPLLIAATGNKFSAQMDKVMRRPLIGRRMVAVPSSQPRGPIGHRRVKEEVSSLPCNCDCDVQIGRREKEEQPPSPAGQPVVVPGPPRLRLSRPRASTTTSRASVPGAHPRPSPKSWQRRAWGRLRRSRWRRHWCSRRLGPSTSPRPPSSRTPATDIGSTTNSSKCGCRSPSVPLHPSRRRQGAQSCGGCDRAFVPRACGRQPSKDAATHGGPSAAGATATTTTGADDDGGVAGLEGHA